MHGHNAKINFHFTPSLLCSSLIARSIWHSNQLEMQISLCVFFQRWKRTVDLLLSSEISPCKCVDVTVR